jgi:catechol 2,3-dioxygenase-like lactoylglutathione lyase family enzyme
LLGRLAWTVWTDLRLVAAGFRYLRAADGILFTGSPPFMIHLLAPLRPLWRGRLVYRITDFHPECLIAARARPSRVLSMLLALTNFWRRRIDGFEVLGIDQQRRLIETGVAKERIALVRDGSPVSFVAGQAAEPLPDALAQSCVLLYAGNYGVAHEVDTVAEGYARHHREGTGRVRLWLSATGSGADELARRLAGQGLPFHSSPPVPIERLPGLLLAADAHLVTLKDAFVGFVMPSKIYACVDSGRPILFVGSSDSDVDLVARAVGDKYWRVACGNAAAFAETLERVADHANFRQGEQAL